MTDFLSARLAAVRRALPDKKIDALLVTDIVNLGYLTGFTGSTAQALVLPTEAVFITDGRYTAHAREECPGFEIVQTPQGSGGYPEALKDVLDARPHLKAVGFEAARVTVAAWEALKKSAPNVLWTATEDVIETLRLVKDAGEIAQIKRAIDVAERAWETAKPQLKAGVRERDFALALEFAMRQGGADGMAFAPIVASGPQGARPHHTPNERVMETGDFVTVDWGATVGGYNSDITRTVLIGAEPTDKQREVYGLVLEAQKRAIDAIAPGRNGKEIDAAARDFLTEHGCGDAFAHSLGHSLGRATHDGAGLSVRSETLTLAPGMVLTVEPGVYLDGWGGVRIEEDVVVTETGCAVLTRLPNALEQVGGAHAGATGGSVS